MKYLRISLIILSLILLMGSNVLSYLGVDEKKFQLFIILLALIPAFVYKHKLIRYKSYIVLLCFIIIFSIIKLFTDKSEGTRLMVLSILCAPILMAAFPLITNNILRFKKSFWRKSFLIFLVCYLIEVSLVILERLIGHSILGWAGKNTSIETSGVVDFRCTGMYGHPLYNALMVSIAMAFILISKLKPKYKFLLWGFGYIAVLCFNTRGSIVGDALLLGIYILSTFSLNRKMKDSTKLTILIMGSIVASIGSFIISRGLAGGRLISMGLLDDGSAQVRVDTIEFLLGVSIKDYLWGMDFKSYNFLLLRKGLSATENFWVDYLIRFGFVFLIGYITLYMMYLKNEFKNYPLFEKYFVTLSFIIIASTNNSLSVSFVALFYFLFLIRLFNPPTFKWIINKEYME